MHWLHSVDIGVFRFINERMSNSAFDVIMPTASGKGVFRLFFAAVIVCGLVMIWKGGIRGRLCVLMLGLILWPSDSYICNTIKHAVARPRPFIALPDVRLPGANGKPKRRPQKLQAAGDVAAGNSSKQSSESAAAGTGASPARSASHKHLARGASAPGHNSMPSSHAANWFAATMILFIYYRRSIWFMLPMACLVAFSRIYNGVHFPSDVAAGAVLGAGYAVAGIWLFNAAWQFVGRRWFPVWWETVPSLALAPPSKRQDSDEEETGALKPGISHTILDAQWLRLGYILIGVLLLARLAYIGSGLIELSGDEAYQWVWSKHLALSYYSKPPLIAYTQFLGTSIFGDNEFGVRFFSPVIGAILSVLLLRFFAREFNARAGFFLVLVTSATPLMAIGAILMTVDPLSVLFWTLAMVAGWRAVQPDAKLTPWLWTGLWMGLGFLSKYTELFQWLCWAVFFVLWKPARVHLRKPGPWLALLINVLCAAPVLIWNQQHHWITVTHVAGDAKAGETWHPTLHYFFDFLEKETALLNPVFFLGTIWASIAFWRRGRHNPRYVYLFSMGAPLFLAYLLFTFHSGVLPNWIAPSVLPLFCLMAAFWDTRWRLGRRVVGFWLTLGLVIGFAANAFLHESDLVKKITGRALPPKPDPLTRVRAFDQVAGIVAEQRAKLAAETGKPVFVIGSHYQLTSLLTFYWPEAKTNVNRKPLVYCETSEVPKNQYYFWPGFEDERKGQNAIYVRELGAPPLVKGWISKWWAGETNLLRYEPEARPPSPELTNEFDSVTSLGLFRARYHGRVFHTLQLYDCRNLH